MAHLIEVTQSSRQLSSSSSSLMRRCPCGPFDRSHRRLLASTSSNENELFRSASNRRSVSLYVGSDCLHLQIYETKLLLTLA